MTIHSQKLIAQCFNQLTEPVYLLDAAGQSILPEGGKTFELPACICMPSIHYSSGFYLFEMLDTVPTMYLAVNASAPGADNLLHLAQGMISCILRGEGAAIGSNTVYRQLLKQELPNSEISVNAQACDIQPDLSRSVIAICAEPSGKQSLYSILAEVIPFSSGDSLVEMDSHLCVLIKEVDTIDGHEELRQFARAVDDTLQQESSLHVYIGIGCERDSLSQLHESYDEARQAIEIGLQFHSQERIFDYTSLILERFLSTVNPDTSQYYQNLIFNRHTQKLLNDEMLHTIEVFFEKDLNLSDTARQLFIHRNTLVYRLEKVQKATGLDLRHFPDAVTFKVLYELKHSLPDVKAK